ncbi:MAG: gfo/Idh/MocA family oxidoreductase, partial [Actinobacteria bacterium]|nr:gfo/Idh/MocA family oxidoreductase [Actinomycetota bacterium]
MKRAGVIGCGLIGRKRLAAFDHSVTLCGVFDVDDARARDCGELFDVTVFSSASELIEEVGPGGLVVVAVPNGALSDVAAQALQAGCHVIVEKPGSTTVEQMQSLVHLSEAHKVVLRVGYNHRFHPAIRRLRQHFTSGRFGEIQLIRARYGHGGREGYEKEWRANAQLSGGGELVDQGSHLLDLCAMMLGGLVLDYVSLPTLYWHMQVEDNALVAAHARTGSAVVWAHASWTEWKNLFSLEVFCKTAKLEVSGLGGSYGPESFTLFEMESGLGIPKQTTETFVPADDSWSLEIDDVWQHILSGAQPEGSTGHDALHVLQL